MPTAIPNRTGIIKTPFEIINQNRGSEKRIVMEELKSQASFGLRQRVVSSYNPDMNDFDLGVFLAYPSQAVPKPEEAMKYLAHAKAGLTDPNKLVTQIPTYNQEGFKRIIYATDRRAFIGELKAINSLLGREGDISPAVLDQFFQRYGGPSGNIFELVADLQKAGFKEKTILSLARMVYGHLRVNTAIAFSNLNSTVRGDPKNWKRDIRYFCQQPSSVTRQEVGLILQTRQKIGLDDKAGQRPGSSPRYGQPHVPPPEEPLRPELSPVSPPPPPTPEAQIKGAHLAYLTDKGRVRPGNEDSVWTDAAKDNDGTVMVVADGMGGHAKGEVASAMAVEMVKKYSSRLRSTQDENYILRELRRVFDEANDTIYNQAQRPDHHGMGTTLTIGFIKGNKLYLAHAGDSRAYQVNNTEMRQLTRDDSWVMDQVEAGNMTFEEAMADPRKNQITKAVGTNPTLRPQLFSVDLQRGDNIVLCTDGLTNMVSDETIRKAVLRNKPSDAVKWLVAAANQKGGGDNITVIHCQT